MEIDSMVMFAAAAAWTEMRLALSGIRKDIRRLDAVKVNKPGHGSGARLLCLLPWAMVAGLLLLSGCGVGARLPAALAPAFHALPSEAPADGTPAGILVWTALAGTALAGAGFLACCIAAMFAVLKVPWLKRAAACLGLAAACQCLYGFALHVDAFAKLGLAAVGLAGLLWLLLHRRQVVEAAEKATGQDLNHDGHIGPQKDQ